MERLGHRSDVRAQVPASEMVTIAVVAAEEEKGEKRGTRLRDERLSYLLFLTSLLLHPSRTGRADHAWALLSDWTDQRLAFQCGRHGRA